MTVFQDRVRIADLEDQLERALAKLAKVEQERDEVTARLVEVESRMHRQRQDPVTALERERYGIVVREKQR